MNFNEIRPNNRLQIEYESSSPVTRSVKGIVLDVLDGHIILITDYGDLLEIYEDKVLSLTKINFDKFVSDTLSEIKAYHLEIYELEQKLKTLKLQEPELRSKLYDSNFLSKFNIVGAKTRLENSIDKSLLDFVSNELTYKISFDANPNEQIELNIVVSKSFEYYNINKTSDVEKIKRIHAPNVKDVIEKSFAFKGEVKEIEKGVMHESDSNYCVSVFYKLFIDVTVDNFLKVREEIIKGLMKLKK